MAQNFSTYQVNLWNELHALTETSARHMDLMDCAVDRLPHIPALDAAATFYWFGEHYRRNPGFPEALLWYEKGICASAVTTAQIKATGTSNPSLKDVWRVVYGHDTPPPSAN